MEDGKKLTVRISSEGGAGSKQNKVRQLIVSMLETLEVMDPTMDETISALTTTFAYVLSRSEVSLGEIKSNLPNVMKAIQEVVEMERKKENTNKDNIKQ